MTKLVDDNRDMALTVFKPSKNVVILSKKAMYIGVCMYLTGCKSWMLVDLNTKNIAMSPGILSDISGLLDELNA